MITDIQKRYNDSVNADETRKKIKKEARDEYSKRFFTYISASFLVAVFFGFCVSVSRLISFASDSAAIVTAFFACFPALKGMFVFCENTVTSGKRDFGLLFSFLYSPGRFVSSFGESLKAAVTLIWALTPFCVTSFALSGYGFGIKYKLLLEILSLFLLFYGAFYWMSYTVFGKTDRESVSFVCSFTLHFVIIYFTKGAWLVFFLPYAALSTVYKKRL